MNDRELPSSLTSSHFAITFLGFLLPVLAYKATPSIAGFLVGNEGSNEWWSMLMLLSCVTALLAGALGGFFALLGAVVGFALARLTVGKLTGDGRMWYLVFVPCLLVMLFSSALTAAVTRNLRRKWRRDE